MTKICANDDCGQEFTTEAGNQVFCSTDCRPDPVPHIRRTPVLNPLRTTRKRKLGDSFPAGFAESLLRGVASHEQRQYSFFDLVMAAALDTRTYPMCAPSDWPGGWEDLREVMDDPEMATLLEKHELRFQYELSSSVPMLVFDGVKPQEKRRRTSKPRSKWTRLAERACLICGKPFTPRCERGIMCSAKCRKVRVSQRGR